MPKLLKKITDDTAFRWNPTKKGISPSFINNFLECKQSALVRWVQGWKSTKFKIAPASGILGHSYLQKIRQGIIAGEFNQNNLPSRDWLDATTEIVIAEFLKDSGRFTTSQREELEFICGQQEIILYHYCRFYRDDFNAEKNKWIMMEEYFKHPFCFPDGEKWALGGFKDAVLKTLIDRRHYFATEETKFKSRFTEGLVADTLRYDTQVMLYSLVLLEQNPNEAEIVVNYNIIRRPGLKLGKDEAWEKFFKRLEKDVTKRPEHYFCRLQMRNSRAFVMEWRNDFLLKVMEEIRWWWNDGNPQARSYINPGALDGKYGPSDLYAILVDGNYSMFKRKVMKYVIKTKVKSNVNVKLVLKYPTNNNSACRRVKVKVKIKRETADWAITCSRAVGGCRATSKVAKC